MFADGVALIGLGASLLAIVGISQHGLIFAIAFICYLTLFKCGQTFYSFQWDILLLEVYGYPRHRGQQQVNKNPDFLRSPTRMIAGGRRHYSVRAVVSVRPDWACTHTRSGWVIMYADSGCIFSRELVLLAEVGTPDRIVSVLGVVANTPAHIASAYGNGMANTLAVVQINVHERRGQDQCRLPHLAQTNGVGVPLCNSVHPL